MIGPLEELVEALCRLPTIGKKSAWRLALYLMEQPETEAISLANIIIKARTNLKKCVRCFNYSEGEICSICSSVSRDRSCICIVEKPVDLYAIERSGRYKGLYHILGGVLSPLNGITVDKLKIKELIERIRMEKPEEIIIGLGSSADADATALYLAKLLKTEPVRVTRLARGLPAGIELEYADQITLTQAFYERKDIKYGENYE